LTDSHTTSNFTTDSNTILFNLNGKLKEADNGLNQSSGFFIEPITSPRSSNNGTTTYRQNRINLPSSTSLYSFKQPTNKPTPAGNTQSRKPKTLSPADQSSKTSLNTLNNEADYAGKSG
jgi:hypothetical protein